MAKSSISSRVLKIISNDIASGKTFGAISFKKDCYELMWASNKNGKYLAAWDMLRKYSTDYEVGFFSEANIALALAEIERYMRQRMSDEDFD